MEYVIQLDEHNYGVLQQGRLVWTNLQYASVFKVKARAEGWLKHFPAARVVPFWGVPAPAGTKKIVTPKQSPINRTSAYRSI